MAEKEQDALSKIKKYLDAGHSLYAVREAGWGPWIDRLTADGFDVTTGQLRLQPPEQAPPDEISELPESTGNSAGGDGTQAGASTKLEPPLPSLEITKQQSGLATAVLTFFGQLFRSSLGAIAWWWRWANDRKTGWGRFIAVVAPPLVVVVIITSVVGAIGGGDGTSGRSPDSVAAVAGDNGDLEYLGGQEPGSSRNDDCIAFLDSGLRAAEQGGRSLAGIGELVNEASLSPLVMSTLTWQSDVRSEYSRLRDARSKFASSTAPTAEMREIKAESLEGFDFILASEEPLLEGATNLDERAIIEAGNLMDRGTESLVLATAMVESIDPHDCVAS